MNLELKIISLINSKREGDYWDFKREPHENNASLLHDIICLANSLHRGKRFLIFGVSDPNDGANVIGLTDGQIGRKSQVQFIDFLRTKPFAGDCRPEIELHTIKINGNDIDVLVIFDNPLKPYYLTQDYRDRDKNVKANFIYSRTNDTNTPIDKSTDIGIIEKMWKQRFGLDLSPLERMKLLLMQPQNWFKDIGNKPYAYHLDFPEFRIEFSEVHEFYETFSFFFTNEKSYLGTATFKYHSTTLFELEYMYCDEMRLTFAVPTTAYVDTSKHKNWFYYYNLEELDGIFLFFLTNGLSNLYSRSSVFPFAIFDNKQEFQKYMEYLKSDDNIIDSVEPEGYGVRAKNRMRREKKESVIDPIFIDKVMQLYRKKDWA